jgi:hypothetical protein
MERGTFVFMAAEQGIQRAVWILKVDGTDEILGPEYRITSAEQVAHLSTQLVFCEQLL